jgi:hypothetical protein
MGGGGGSARPTDLPHLLASLTLGEILELEESLESLEEPASLEHLFAQTAGAPG